MVKGVIVKTYPIREFIQSLLEEYIQKNRNGIWIDEGSPNLRYTSFATTIYISRAIFTFYQNDLNKISSFSSWNKDVTLRFLLNDPSIYAKEWKQQNQAVSVREEDVLLHLKSLVVHTLLFMLPYFEYKKDVKSVKSIKSVSKKYISEIVGVQNEMGSFGRSEPDRLWFTSRKLITLYYYRLKLGKDFKVFSRKVDVKKGLEYIIKRIDSKYYIIFSLDSNFNTHIEESAIGLEALSLWRRYYPSLRKNGSKGRMVKKLAVSMTHNIPDIYSGSVHDISHVVSALYYYLGSKNALMNRDFVRILNILLNPIIERRMFETESRTNHPNAEVLSTLASIAKDHKEIPSSPKVFISYSHKDKKFVNELVKELIRRGFSVWQDVISIGVGERILKRMREGIESCPYFLFIITPSSLKSKFANDEFEYFNQLRIIDENERKFIPILLKKCKIPDYLGAFKYLNCRDKNPNKCADNIKKWIK